MQAKLAIALKLREIKVAKWGTPKKIFKKKRTIADFG
jgi:hypothetical protein